MGQTSTIIIFVIVVTGVIIGVIRARKMNKEQSSLTMHPDNFKKPEIEQVEIKRGDSSAEDKDR